MNESRARDIIGLTTEKLNEDLVRKLYKKLALIYHPDKGGNEETFKRLNTAYEYLLEKIRTTPGPSYQPSAQSKTNPGTSNQPPKTNPGTSNQPPKTNPGTSNQPPKTNPGTSNQPPKTNPDQSTEDIRDYLFGIKKCLYDGCNTKIDGIEATFGKLYCVQHSKASIRKTSNECCSYILKSGQRCKKKALLGFTRCILHYKNPENEAKTSGYKFIIPVIVQSASVCVTINHINQDTNLSVDDKIDIQVKKMAYTKILSRYGVIFDESNMLGEVYYLKGRKLHPMYV